MALSYDTKARIPPTALDTTTSAASASYTCGANAEVLVVLVCWAGTTARTGGAPTYNGIALTQGETQQGVTETAVEFWYLLAPPVGIAYTLNVPNDGGRTMWVYVASANAAAGSTIKKDSSGVNATTGSNPNVSYNAVNTPTLAFAVVATGDNAFSPTARTGTSLYEEDVATYGSGAQYYAKTGTGSQALSWSDITSDDYGAIAVAFYEAAGAGRIYLGTAQLTASPIPASVLTPTVVGLNTATMSLAAPALDVVPGAVAIPLDTAGISAIGIGGTISAVEPNTLTVTSPVSYRVFQRSGTTGTIAITGTYTGSPTAIEASFNGGSYATIDASPTGGTFSGSLTNQAQGQGTLTVRFTNDTDANDTATYVGIGDVFIIGGQSNAVGYASGNLTYSHATLKAGMFGNDYNWKELVDPLDDDTNQVDLVSDDGTFGGSCWLPLATLFLAHQEVPCAFVPCALADTNIAQWQPGADHQDRSTLYGSMIYRALQTGAKIVLWWQGESDIVNGTDPDTYNANLDTIANAVYADLGVKLMPCTIQDMSTVYEGFDESIIDAHIREAWNDNANVAAGPDLEDYDFPVGVLHYDTADAPAIAQKWWDALLTEFYAVPLATAQLTATGIPTAIDAPIAGITVVLDTALLWFGSSYNRQRDINTATLTATPIPLTVIPGAVTIGLQTATLSATPIPATISAPVTRTLATASLTASGIPASVDAPISRTLATAQATATGINATISAPALGQTIILGTASLTATPIPASVVPGAVSISLDTAALTATGGRTYTTPTVFISLNTASVTASGIGLDVVPGAISVPLNTAALAGSGIALEVAPGTATISLATASLVATGIGATISATPTGATIALHTATLSAAGIALDVVPGAVSLSLDTAALSAVGIPASVSTFIPLYVSLDTAGITASPISISHPWQSVRLDTTTLTAAPIPGDIIPGAVSKLLATAILAAAGIDMTIFSAGIPGRVTGSDTLIGSIISTDALRGDVVGADSGIHNVTGSDTDYI